VRVERRKVFDEPREAHERSAAEARSEIEKIETSKGKTTKEGASAAAH
jgi:hypothetical protein